ncbi:U11/U12 small nuclear ribonucleoprotein 48 kDa protein isoform X1 [Neodiprion pinetum]|uniref:U11/U12 small nuclear ribonucleoprotein 48 kDa protein isoform X1 n=1 Tax=Neodiprion pinetum TaxID=441929 RepID=UPI001EDCA69B|nr:U11/U12 small nuclear ribonucleoprotein 48 kDa protein-like isoform X1 [Neodiprion pinetum]XP_046478107.1 U11/U12 small nuclear ribonucleoprotein 48 kDa protein-like isoform X1 [Neodiprion pinetum]
MSEINEEREKQLQDLNSFIQLSYEQLTSVVSSLGWTIESISNESQTTVACPFDNGHRVKEASLGKHLEKCQWKAEGYTEYDLPLSEPCPSVDPSSSIKFDEHLQDEVLLKAREQDPTMHTAAGIGDRLIPRTSDRLTASFTSDERKAVYDYVIANTITPDIGCDIADMNNVTKKDKDSPKTSLLELLAQERNLKRRRAKHRGVHTNKKSQVEILREVINQQMEMYEEYITDSLIKIKPKSSVKLEASSSDFHTDFDKKNLGNKYSSEWPRKSSTKSDKKKNFYAFSPGKKSPTQNNDLDCVKRRNRSLSRGSERQQHHSRHTRGRSKERSRHQDVSRRYRRREEKSWNKAENNYQTEEDKTKERKKRGRSRERSEKYVEKSRRHEKYDGGYFYKHQRVRDTSKNSKKNP